jgi:pteridine reductase
MSRIENSPSRPRTALVTGAARRIGRAIAEALHDAGMDVAIHCRRSTSEAQAVSKYLNEERQDSAKVFCGDLVKAGMPAELIDSVINWNGRLDVLVNNASSFYPTPLGQISEADWSDIVGSNLKAPLFLSQAAAGALRSSRGSIVNIVDIHAKKPLRDHAVYGAAKAGLVMLTRSLAKDLAPEVRVNAVAPGAIAWPENGMPQSVKDHILGEIPLGRSGDPEDIATTVRFLALEATYVTGEIITVDGGRSIGW